MDACDPSIDIRNLKKLVKQNTGLELKLTRAEICDAYSSIQDGKLPLPPMVLSKDGKYMLDRKSPLTGRDFEILFSESSKLAELKRVARKAGLSSYDKMTKAEITDAVESILKSKNIREPIRLHVRPPTASKRRVSVNNNSGNYQSNFNVNNKNGNGVRNNLSKISRESENLGGNNQNQNQNQPKNNQNESKNLNKISTESKNLNSGGNNNTKKPVNATTARYLNAMTRKPNANRNTDIAKILSAMRNKNQSPGNISRLIQSIQGKRTTNSETKTYLNKFIRAQKEGNATAMKNIAKRLNAMERERRVAKPQVTNKEKRLAELEKYMLNKSKNLGTNRVKFLNGGQKFIRGYKNGNNMYNTAKARINGLYAELKNKKPLNSQLTPAPQPTIPNQPRNEPASTEFKKLQSQLAKSNNTIKELQQRIRLANTNKKQQNALREALQKEKNRKNSIYEQLRKEKLNSNRELENLKQKRNVNLKNMNVMREQLGNMKTNINTKNRNIQLLKNKQKSNLEEIRKQRNVNLKNMNVMREQLGNMKTNINTKNRNIQLLKNKLSESTSPTERKQLENRLAQETQNLANMMREAERKQKVINKQKSNLEEIRKQKENSNAQIAIKNQELQKIQNKKQRAEAIINNLKRNRESKLEEIRKQKENTNAQIAIKNQEIIQIKKNMASAGSLSIAQKEKLRQNLEKAQTEMTGFREQLKMAERRLAEERVAKNTKIRLLEANVSLSRQELNALKAERNNLKQKRNINLKNMNVMREQLGNLKINRNALEAESQRRKNALNNAVAKEVKITKELHERNASIANLQRQQQRLLQRGELNAQEKKRLSNLTAQIRTELNAKNIQIEEIQKLSNNREAQIKELGKKFNNHKAAANKIIRNSAGRIQSLEKLVEQWQTNSEEKRNQIAKMSENLNAKNKNIEQLTQQIQAILNKRSNNASTISKQKAALKRALEQVSKLEEEVLRAQSESSRLATQLEQAQELQSQTRTQLAGSRWQGLVGKKQVSRLRNNTKALDSEIRAGVEAQTRLKNNLSKMTGQRQALLQKFRNERKLGRERNTRIGALRSQRNLLTQRNRISRGTIQSLQGQRNLATSKLNIEELRKNLYQRVNRLPPFKFSKGDLRNRIMKAQSMGEMRSIQQELNSKQPQKTGGRGQGWAATGGRTGAQNWRYE